MHDIVAEQFLDLLGSDQKVTVRLYRPERYDEETWRCRFEIGAPIGRALNVSGESSLQALSLAVFGLSAALYSTELYQAGQLGAFGAFSGFLGIPAPSSYKDIAPHTF